ncbi:XTP/dITP diphosphatase [Shouchella lonarensis]|uniref:dITP/XTP pyrophosphatase n=1 Tax=Shouchella lonarensis TaxID=1464122 RepID=A0A1G6K177_9BACI|nr:XTP/dITP diphosphatase [Shouchella lonarensis]SDC24734.1 XTP/dITP diphosphohydrolase [Shouchella lonarensis]
MSEIIIATENQGKIAEFEAMLSPTWEVKSLYDYPTCPSIIEDGATFHENAAKKSETLSRFLGKTVIADDSGLMIDALDGAPGVYSARYAGESRSDEENIKKVLSELAEMAPSQRTARFYCVIAISEPGSKPRFVEGTCEGSIAIEPSGTHGFGYDPIFFVPAYGKTMAQLSPEVKNKISHRAKALAVLKQVIGGTKNESIDCQR